MDLTKELQAKSFTEMESDNFHLPTLHLHKPAIFLDDVLSIIADTERAVGLKNMVSDETGGQEDESDKKCQQLESMGKKTFDCGMPATHYCFDTKDYYCSEHAMIAIIAGLKQRNIFKKS